MGIPKQRDRQSEAGIGGDRKRHRSERGLSERVSKTNEPREKRKTTFQVKVEHKHRKGEGTANW